MMEKSSNTTKSKVLVTGGLGFIFSYVTEYLVANGYDVVVIDNQSVGSHPEIIDGSFTYYNLDICSPEARDVIIDEQPDYVIHAAAVSDVDHSIKDPSWVIESNVQGTINVFEACRQLPSLKKLVYISTDEVYGECEDKKYEDEILFPKNPYACSKAFGSLLRITYDNTYPELKDKTAETRFCNVFGPRQDNRKIMAAIKDSIDLGYEIPIHKNGKGYREYIYVKNIPEAVELVMLKGDRVYNVTSNDGYTVSELIDMVRQMGFQVKTKEGDRPGMDMKYQMNNFRILDLGWRPRFSFREGIRDYLNA